MMTEIAISSWSVHGLLGQVWYEPDADGNLINKNAGHTATLSLLELPAYIAKDGIQVMEVCHFHFPSLDDDYLAKFKSALESAGVTLANVLIDTGNLSNLDDAQRRADIELAKHWQDIAAKVGAKGCRIDCGTESATPETMKRSADALRELVDYGDSIGLTTTTENWRDTSIQPDNLLEIMRQVNRPLKLCVDFGNAEKTDDKYGTIQALMPYSTSIHCKGHFDGKTLDVDEFERSLALVKASDFDGHIALICGETEDEWDKILTLKQHVERVLL